MIEKHQTLLILKSLEKWRERLQFKYAKYNLLHQVEQDQQMRTKGRVFDAIRQLVYEQKEEKIYEMMQRQQVNHIIDKMVWEY